MLDSITPVYFYSVTLSPRLIVPLRPYIYLYLLQGNRAVDVSFASDFVIFHMLETTRQDLFVLVRIKRP